MDLVTEQSPLSGNKARPANAFTRFELSAIEQSIPSRFEHIVATYPDRPSAKDKHYALTYKELDEAANRVARAVLNHGATGEAPIALLGILLMSAETPGTDFSAPMPF